MSDNNSGTGQITYPVNLSSNHAAAVAAAALVTRNRNLKNQVAGVCPNDQIQNSQPPLPLIPPPQQPPSLPYPQHNWYNGYYYNQQVSPHGLVTYPTYAPYYLPQYLSNSTVPHVLPTAFPAFRSINQILQGEMVGNRSAGSGNVNTKQGPVKQWPEMSWKIISNSVAAQRFGNHKKSLNNKGEDNSVAEADTCKSSSSKIDITLVTADGPKINCDENGLVSESDSNSNSSEKGAALAGANAIPGGSGAPMSTCKSIGDQSTLSSLSSTAPNIVANDNLNFLPNETPRRSTDSDEESAQDDDVPSRKRQRSCDSLSFEKNVDDESMKFSNSIKSLPREELERITIAHYATIAELKRQLNHSNERVETLEREVKLD